MKVITTKYFGPSSVKGARFRAYDGDGNVALASYRHDLSYEAAHEYAADVLKKKMKWTGKTISGQQKDGIYVHVFVEEGAR